VRKFKNQFGFVTVAQNNNTTNYLELAYIQATNIKKTQTLNQYAVIVDNNTAEQITDEHRSVFDYIIILPTDLAESEQWKMANETQLFNLTPFKETIKLESDLVFTRDISHWLYALRLRDICFSYHCRDYQGTIKTQTSYRKLFELNDLPDVYTGMYYFRYSQTAAEFFRLARAIYTNWPTIKEELVQCVDSPSTDVVFALTAKIIGIEQCAIPSLDFFNFAHMKSSIQGWDDQQPWTDYVNVEYDYNMLRINNINQYQPVHYYQKEFYSD
jgi:protein-tyrosine-phosphatase